MKFRTEISLPESSRRIDFHHRILGVGSCFAERIGGRLKENRFDSLINPLGIVYNPVSMIRLLLMSLEEKPEVPARYAEHLHAWHSFDLHSNFNRSHEETFTKDSLDALKATGEWLKKADWLILTMGTALVYRQKSDREVVSNCHKYPAEQFTRDLLTPAMISEAFYQLIRKIQAVNPSLNILLTVSPVRHTKDGLTMNSTSKATLRLAAHQLTQSFDHVHYFPAYEIMMDDLRDYRYYEDDLIHPTTFAEDYIWEKFTTGFMSDETRKVMGEWAKIRRDLGHRPLNPWSPQYRGFLEKLLDKLEKVKEFDCSEEINQVREHLRGLDHPQE